MWKHRCLVKPKQPSSSKGKKRQGQVRKGKLLLPPAQGRKSCDVVHEVLDGLRSDDVALCIKGDPLIVELAKQMCLKMDHDGRTINYIRCKLREVARLLLTYRTSTGKENATLSSIISPQAFGDVVRSVRETAGFNQETNNYTTPSLALKLGHLLKQTAGLQLVRATKTRDTQAEQMARDFITLMEEEWETEVSSHADSVEELHSTESFAHPSTSAAESSEEVTRTVHVHDDRSFEVASVQTCKEEIFIKEELQDTDSSACALTSATESSEEVTGNVHVHTDHSFEGSSVQPCEEEKLIKDELQDIDSFACALTSATESSTEITANVHVHADHSFEGSSVQPCELIKEELQDTDSSACALTSAAELYDDPSFEEASVQPSEHRYMHSSGPEQDEQWNDEEQCNRFSDLISEIVSESDYPMEESEENEKGISVSHEAMEHEMSEPAGCEVVPFMNEDKHVKEQNVQSFDSDNTGGAYVMRTHNQGTKRAFDKVAYCLYCSKPQKKLPRHLRQHKNEAEVAAYMAEKAVEKRQRLLTIIRNKGNHKHNCEVIAEDRGGLVVIYRPTHHADPKDYVPCFHCFGWFSKLEMWKHRCLVKPKQPSSSKGKKRHGQVRKGKPLLPPALGRKSCDIVHEVLDGLRSDNVALCIKGDPLIVELAKQMCLKMEHDGRTINYIRCKLREVARLLLTYRTSTGKENATLSSIISAQAFGNVVRSVRETAGFNQETHDYTTPSLALKLGHLLKQTAGLQLVTATKIRDTQAEQMARDFITLMEEEWETEVSSRGDSMEVLQNTESFACPSTSAAESSEEVTGTVHIHDDHSFEVASVQPCKEEIFIKEELQHTDSSACALTSATESSAEITGNVGVHADHSFEGSSVQPCKEEIFIKEELQDIDSSAGALTSATESFAEITANVHVHADDSFEGSSVQPCEEEKLIKEELQDIDSFACALTSAAESSTEITANVHVHADYSFEGSSVQPCELIKEELQDTDSSASALTSATELYDDNSFEEASVQPSEHRYMHSSGPEQDEQWNNEEECSRFSDLISEIVSESDYHMEDSGENEKGISFSHEAMEHEMSEPAGCEVVSGGSKDKNVREQTVRSFNSDNTGGAYVMRTHNQGTKRSHDKVAYCLYCSKPQKKLTRHLLQHKKEAEVTAYMAEQSVETKRRLLTIIRNKGNHKHNCDVVAEDRGGLVVIYRPTHHADPKDYVPCFHCFGWFSKLDMWKHRCLVKPKQPSRSKGKKRHCQVRKGKLLLPPAQGRKSCDIVHEVLDGLRSDDVALCIKGDDLIVELAKQMYLKMDHNGRTINYIRCKLREVGRFLLTYRTSTGKENATLSSIISPQAFGDVVRSVREMAGFNQEPHDYTTPSLALKLGHLLKQTAGIQLVRATKIRDTQAEQMARHFITLMEEEWETEVPSHADSMEELHSTESFAHPSISAAEFSEEVTRTVHVHDDHSFEVASVQPCKEEIFIKEELQDTESSACALTSATEFSADITGNVGVHTDHSFEGSSVQPCEEEKLIKEELQDTDNFACALTSATEFSTDSTGNVGVSADHSFEGSSVQPSELIKEELQGTDGSASALTSATELYDDNSFEEASVQPSEHRYMHSSGPEQDEQWNNEEECNRFSDPISEIVSESDYHMEDSGENEKGISVSHEAMEHEMSEPAGCEVVSGGSKDKNVREQTVQSFNSGNTGGAYVMRTHNQGTKRAYDKVAYCLYCSKPQKKLPQHLLKHKSEAEVAAYMAEKSAEKKQRLLTIIRNKGNHKHNCEVIAEDRGGLVVIYRPTHHADTKDYVPCFHCFGWFSKLDMWKHRCLVKPKQPSSSKGKKRHGQVRKGKLLIPPAQGRMSCDIVHEVLDGLRSDDVALCIKGDDLIVELAKQMCLKMDRDGRTINYIRCKLREVARLLLTYRTSTGKENATLSSIISPQAFGDVVRSVRETAGFNQETHDYTTPSLALKLGHLLKQTAGLQLVRATKIRDTKAEQLARDFIILMEKEWETEVFSHALRTLDQQKRSSQSSCQ